MKRFSHVLRLAVCVSVLAMTLSVPVTRAAGPPSGLDVNVVNTPSNPVPVTLHGTSTVSGNVAITNTPLPVEDVREPFQADNHNFSQADAALSFPTVPAGKRLVVEHVSVEVGITAAGVAVSVCALNRTDGGPADFFAVQPTASNALNHIFVGSVQTKYYVDSGKSPQVSCSVLAVAGGSSAGGITAFISGHLTPAP
jgi:hypothetical protein